MSILKTINGNLGSTKPHDQLYALLSVPPDGLGIKTDYKKPVSDALCDFVHRHISKYNNLDILKGGCLYSIAKEVGVEILPSWAHNLAQPFPTGFQSALDDGHGYSAGIRQPTIQIVDVTTFQDPKKLKLLGIMIDKVGKIAEIPQPPVLTSDGLPKPFLKFMPPNSSDLYFNGQHAFESYWRTLIFDMNGRGQIVTRLKGDNVELFRQAFISFAKARPLLSFWKSEIIDPEVKKTQSAILKTLQAGNRGYTFGYTRNKYMTMLLEGTKEGDILCILYRLQTPHVLRASVSPLEDTYAIIGPAYVHGFMDGEAFTWHSRGRLEEQQFVLI
jgi:hypothetical protein